MNGDMPGDAIDVTDDPIPRRAILPAWLKAAVSAALVLASASIFIGVMLFVTINNERGRNVRNSCEETNRRHNSTVARLDARLDKAKLRASPAQANRLRESREFTVSLIDALQPVQDCDEVVRDQVGSSLHIPF